MDHLNRAPQGVNPPAFNHEADYQALLAANGGRIPKPTASAVVIGPPLVRLRELHAEREAWIASQPAGQKMIVEQPAVEQDGPRGDRANQSGQSPGELQAKLAAIKPVLDRVRRIDHWFTPRGGSHSHRTEMLTDRLVEQHLASKYGVGACYIERGTSTTRVALLDFDSHKGETSWAEMCRIAGEVRGAAFAVFDVTFTAFRSSGGKGIHLIAIWAEPQDARSVRARLAEILAAFGLRNAAGGGGVAKGEVEIFPKQDSVPADGWGTMVVLPGTGESLPLDPLTFEPINWGAVGWAESVNVPVVAPVVYLPAVVEGSTPELSKVRSALEAIDPNDLDYGGSAGSIGWLEMLFATHAATEGSADGLALFLEWSSRWSGFDATASQEHTVTNWNAAKLKPGGIGAGTLFRRAIDAGWVDPDSVPNADGLEVIPEPVGGSAGRALVRAGGRPISPFEGDMPKLMEIVRGKAVIYPGNATNHLRAIQHPAFCGFRLRRDAFTAGQTEIDFGHGRGWEPFTDDHYAPIRAQLEQLGLESSSKEHVRDTVKAVAKLNEYDSGLDILNGLPAWDGVDRISKMLSAYFGAADSPYTSAVAHYMMTALVGRIRVPGIKADMVPVLSGAQGLGKTAGLMALLHDPANHYSEIDLSKRDADQARQLRGVIIGELAELKGKGAREMEAIKAFLTREVERWEKKFEENTTTYKRRNIFIGTTNEEEFLVDDTGNRRWLPIRVGVTGPVKVEVLAADRDQLYAQALAEFKAGGIAWRPLAADDYAMLRAEQRDGFEASTPVYELLQGQYLFDREPTDFQRRSSVAIWSEVTMQPAGIATRSAMKETKAAVLRLWRENGKTRMRGGKLEVFVRSDRPGASEWKPIYAPVGRNFGLLLPPPRRGLDQPEAGSLL